MNELKTYAKLSKGKILDIGYYENPNPYLKGYVLGIDIKIKDRPENYIDVYKADITQSMPFDYQEFDTIIIGYTLEHIEKHIQVLKNINYILKDNGKLIISVPNPHYYWCIIHNFLGFVKDDDINSHIHSFTKRDMIRILKMTGFRNIRCYGTNFMIPKTKIKFGVPSMFGYGIIYEAKK